MPVRTSFNGVEVLFLAYLDEFVGVGHWAVVPLVVAAVTVLATAPLEVVVVVFYLSVGAVVIIIAGCPMERGIVVWAGLSNGEVWGQWCGGWGVPPVDGGGLGGGTPLVVWVGHG